MTIPDAEGTAILTGAFPLTRRLLYRHGERQKKAGLKSWPTPPIFPLASWIKDRWAQSWPRRHVLSTLQSVQLWETIIKSGSAARKMDLLHLRGAAARAAQTYAIVKQYRLPTGFSDFQWTHESEAFHRWMTEYDKRLDARAALDPASVLDAVREAMEDGSIPLPPGGGIILAGFDEITPQLETWLNFLKSNRVTVQFSPEPSGLSKLKSGEPARGGAVEVRRYKDPSEEAVQCARWIRALYAPGKTFGVIVPELDTYADLLKRELTAELAPQSVFPWTTRDLPFDMSRGTSLAREPLLHLALSLLAVPGDPAPFETISAFLGATSLRGGSGEARARHDLDSKLRRQNATAVYLDRLDALIDKETSPKLHAAFRLWKELIGNRERLPPSAWAYRFSLFLRRVGWPSGDASWTDPMRAIYRSWTECLDAFASLDGILGNVTRLEAAGSLSQFAEEKLFQAGAGHQAIQIAGLQESAGMEFDHLWVPGCTADVLPNAPSPNPFLPLKLQKNIPHSNSDWELQFAERALARLLASAPDIVFSFPARDQEKEQMMSPLLKRFPKPRTVPGITRSNRILDQFRPSSRLEHWRDEPSLPPLARDELETLKQSVSRKGYSVLKNQAACPFRAFALYRLNADKVSPLEIDFDAAQRGTLIHNVLELFWKKTRNKSNLQRLKNDGRLDETIKRCVDRAMRDSFASGVFTAQRMFSRLERERVAELTRSWMEVELLRSDFEVVLEEKRAEVEVGGLELHIRIDRMDKIEGDKLLLIDYKTGKYSVGDWFQERIQEPQLPLYALKFLPDGLAYAAVVKNEKDRVLDAVVRDPGKFQGIKPNDYDKKTGCSSWEELMEYWRKHLTALAEQFLAGRLEADPFKGKNTCRNCGLESLCRIGETRRDIVDTEAEA